MKQRNSHARSKRKRKLLRLKNFFTSVFTKRLIKKEKAFKPKGKTLKGEMKKMKLPLIRNYDKHGYGDLFDHEHAKNLNQRQKRKARRQQPHGHFK